MSMADRLYSFEVYENFHLFTEADVREDSCVGTVYYTHICSKDNLATHTTHAFGDPEEAIDWAKSLIDHWIHLHAWVKQYSNGSNSIDGFDAYSLVDKSE